MGLDVSVYVSSPDEFSELFVYSLAYDFAEAFDDAASIARPDADEDIASLMPIAIAARPPADLRTPARPARTWLHVFMGGTRYYGRGYERGPLPMIIGAAAWLEHRLPNAQVWYGHDQGDPYELFDAGARASLFEYFASVGHSPYRRPVGSPSYGPQCHGRPMTNVSGGRPVFRCAACGFERSE